MRPQPAPSSTAGSLFLVAAAAAVGAAVLAGGGIGDSRLLWIGGAAIVLAAAALAVGPRPRIGLTAAAACLLVAAFVAWNGASVRWSVEPDRSWAYLNRGLAYIGFLALGAFFAALVPRAPRRAAAALLLVVAAAVFWALLGKVFPGLGPDQLRNARLRAPVDYANGLALLAAIGLPLALGLAASPRHRTALRVGATVLLYGFLVALLLTGSRGGLAVAAVAVALWLAFGSDRLESAAAIVVAGAAAAAVAGWAFTRPALVDPGRAGDGGWFALALLLGAGAVAMLGVRAARLELGEPQRRRAGQALAVALVLAAAAAAATLATVGVPGGSEVTQQPGRIGTLSSNSRSTWWRESRELFSRHRVEGTGAGSFEVARKAVRRDSRDVIEPHSFPFQVLGELGIVGVLLAGSAAVAAAIALALAVAGAGAERPLLLALALVPLAWALQALVDIDWDLLAVSAPAFFALGVVIAAGRPAAPRSVLPALAAALAAAAVLVSLGAPWLAERRTAQAYDLVFDLPARAVAKARQAHSLNPLALDPLFAEARAEDAQGHRVKAYRLYVKAVERQPDNSESWLALGQYALLADSPRVAYNALNRAYTLDPYGPAGEPGGLLDRARCAIDPATCPR